MSVCRTVLQLSASLLGSLASGGLTKRSGCARVSTIMYVIESLPQCWMNPQCESLVQRTLWIQRIVSSRYQIDAYQSSYMFRTVLDPLTSIGLALCNLSIAPAFRTLLTFWFWAKSEEPLTNEAEYAVRITNLPNLKNFPFLFHCSGIEFSVRKFWIRKFCFLDFTLETVHCTVTERQWNFKF